jgi:hypothetical protein
MTSQKVTKSASVLGAVLLLVTIHCRAETASDGSIREFFTASGQEAQLVEGVQSILPALKQMARDMPEDLFRELARTDNIAGSMIPIYRKYFSEEEIRELIAFYKTPIGSKYAKLAGKIQREGMEVNARQGQMTVINYQTQKGKFTVEPSKK